MTELAQRCLAHGPFDGANATTVDGLYVFRRSAVSEPERAVYKPAIFLVAQGRKRARVGDEAFVYDPDHYLVTSVPLPVTSEILVASPDLAFRFVELLDRPGDVPVLAPLYRRELLYHVLKGPRGGFLRAIAMGHGQQRAVAEVLAVIHADCTQTFSVGHLAVLAGMSESAFYEAFKSVTASTPMQYIKRLRLQEAYRQLTLGLNNVSGAASSVGYHSLSQFSREFTRVFGANPSSYVPSTARAERESSRQRRGAPAPFRPDGSGRFDGQRRVGNGANGRHPGARPGSSNPAST